MFTYFFIIFGVIAVAAALAMIISRNTVNSALFLVINMGSLAVIYLLLNAQFLAVIQVLIYAGAIMVLFLFVIMLLNIDAEKNLFNKFRFKYIVAFLFGAGILAQILYGIGAITHTLPKASPKMGHIGTVEAVGKVLFSRYLFPFELTAILLTAAIIGALLIAQHKIKPKTDND
ncbi:MAG TPA: NADH-quinone oxidoreductase subunit J [Balneolaceae bacterium]|nr:NADH-quinone oxidoreductase subunit J [Balneolaceae bacterium]